LKETEVEKRVRISKWLAYAFSVVIFLAIHFLDPSLRNSGEWIGMTLVISIFFGFGLVLLFEFIYGHAVVVIRKK
jgi:hypothetical protein